MTSERTSQLSKASEHPDFAHLVGILREDDLDAWLTAELGRPDALDRFAPHGNITSKAVAPRHILHIVSGNTPHAALQSVFRGLLLGSSNTVKIPSSGLPELESWISDLPSTLKDLVSITHDIGLFDWPSADAIIAIGSDQTIQSIQSRIMPHQIFIPHGHKISIGIVENNLTEAAHLAAKDICLFDQRGCLSLQAIYANHAPEFARLLADAMQQFSESNPSPDRTLSEAGAIHNFRETHRFYAANSEEVSLWHSDDSQDWTVLYKKDTTLAPSCLGCCVTVMPLPTELNQATLGEELSYLSTIALHPFSQANAERLTHLGAHRICPLGKAQQPSHFWHHDGFAPLTSLVKWQDIG